MDDYQVGGKLLNYTGKYYVTLTSNRAELYDIIQQRHLKNMNQAL